MGKPVGERYTVCVDFDGVLHSYTSPWVAPEVIPDPPVEGAIEWLNEIGEDFAIAIFTTRGKTEEGRQAVCDWLYAHGFTGVLESVGDRKIPALVYIDDRGWRFDGTNFPTPEQIHRARPWNKAAR